METSVINIGKSKGVELNKTLIDKYHITDTIELVFRRTISSLNQLEYQGTGGNFL